MRVSAGVREVSISEVETAKQVAADLGARLFILTTRGISNRAGFFM